MLSSFINQLSHVVGLSVDLQGVLVNLLLPLRLTVVKLAERITTWVLWVVGRAAFDNFEC